MSTLLASRPTTKPPGSTRAIFQQIVFAALFCRQQGSLVFGAVEGWAPQISPAFCASSSSIIVWTKELPYWELQQMRTLWFRRERTRWCGWSHFDFFRICRVFLVCNLPEICFIIFHTEPMSTGISLNIIAFCYYCWFNWFVVSLCPLALEPGHAFDTFHVWDSMGVSDAKRYGFRVSCQQNLVSLTLSKSLCRFDLHTLFAPVKNAIVSSQKATGCTAKILCVNVSFSLKRFVSEIEMSKFMRFLPAKIECSYKQAKTTTDHRR